MLSKGSLNSNFPAFDFFFNNLIVFRWFKATLNTSQIAYFTQVFPVTDCQTSKESGTKSGCFRSCRADNGDTENISLKLHHKIIARSPSVNFKFPQFNIGITCHTANNIHCLESNAFKGSTSDMSCFCPSTDIAYQPSCIRIPPRSTKTGKCWNKIYSVCIWNSRCKFLNLCRCADNSKSVTQPLDNRTGNKILPSRA